MNSSRYFWSSFFSVYLLINLILLINCVTSKKAYARDEKFGKSGGLNPMIKQKYCNLDNYLLDEQNHQIFECIFKPTNVKSTEIRDCVEKSFPSDDFETSYTKMRKAVCTKDITLREFVVCIREGKGLNHGHIVDKCLLIKSSKKRESCYDKMQRDTMKCFVNILGIK
ncbi:uncharacterized protein LOC128393492 [Panonychus citri]|uniref:uncharacterized protein LOC128393492 n=1 Tax=Panonychus citri TaxID=50023 RepID=UPI00230833A2|nr:uncharacterized protein LOC128393492 [Panonychus citri]